MRILQATLLAVVATLGGCVSTKPHPPATMAEAAPKAITVMSFNIRLGVGPEDPKVSLLKLKWGRNLPAVIAAVRAVHPDILSLQEVSGADQAREIAAATGMNVSFVAHGNGSERSQAWGVALLSRFPITDTRDVQISSGDGDTRHILIATLDVAGRRLDAVAVHKDKDLKDGKSILNILGAIGPADVPTLLIGDFNITPADKRLKPLHARFFDTCAHAHSVEAMEVTDVGTFPSSKRRIDYVFADKAHFQVLAARLAPPANRKASDHIAYIAELAFKD